MKAYTCGDCGHIQIQKRELKCNKCGSKKVKKTWTLPKYDTIEESKHDVAHCTHRSIGA